MDTSMAHMSRKSSTSSRTPKAIDAPFDPAVLKRARTIAAGYRIVLEPSETLGYVGSSIEMPGVFDAGKTPDECFKKTRDALMYAVATMIEAGERPPTGKAKRTMQVNIRLSPEEKYQLEAAAARLGFRAISDFLRAAGLERGARA
jgi:predicted RNase H-like HicB family nuclease